MGGTKNGSAVRFVVPFWVLPRSRIPHAWARVRFSASPAEAELEELEELIDGQPRRLDDRPKRTAGDLLVSRHRKGLVGRMTKVDVAAPLITNIVANP